MHHFRNEKKKRTNATKCREFICIYLGNHFGGACGGRGRQTNAKNVDFSWNIHLELVYFVTALVPSDTACLASSPGSSSLTAVCTSLLVMVERLLYWARRDASVAIRSNRSFTKEFIILMARLEMPVSGWTYRQVKQNMLKQFKTGKRPSVIVFNSLTCFRTL